MDLIAIALFAIGVLLVAAGYFLNQQNGRSDRSAQMVAEEMAKYANKEASQSIPIDNHHYQTTPQPTLAPQPQHPLNQQTSTEVNTNQFANKNFQVEVVVQNQNPKLFEKAAYLYLDSSKQNNYTGTEAAFKLQEVMGIRRFGQGIFSYDGFVFRFEHPGGVEKFALENLDHMAFYPNCIVLVLKSDLPAALLFVDETDSIRRILETFKVEHVI